MLMRLELEHIGLEINLPNIYLSRAATQVLGRSVRELRDGPGAPRPLAKTSSFDWVSGRDRRRASRSLRDARVLTWGHRGDAHRELFAEDGQEFVSVVVVAAATERCAEHSSQRPLVGLRRGAVVATSSVQMDPESVAMASLKLERELASSPEYTSTTLAETVLLFPQ